MEIAEGKQVANERGSMAGKGRTRTPFGAWASLSEHAVALLPNQMLTECCISPCRINFCECRPGAGCVGLTC